MTAPPGLARKRAVARAALWFEQIWPAVWPPVGLTGLYLAAALLDLPAYLPPWPRIVLPALVLAGAGLLLWRGLRRVTPPDADAIDRRLERETGLRHRPLSALQDRPAAPTAEAEAVWRVHQSRLLRTVQRLRVGRPRPGLPSRDRWALRGGLLVVLFAGLVIAGRDAPARLLAAIAPGFPAGPASPGTVVQAWVTPPSYTGVPPLFLRPETPSASVPVGSAVTVSVTGGNGTPAVTWGGGTLEVKALDKASWQAEQAVSASARLSVERGGLPIAVWSLTSIPDYPPNAEFAEPPGAAQANGRALLQTRLSWRATDDYGVVALDAELRLKERPHAEPLVLPAPLAGSVKQARGALVRDLTAHPWAGLAVTARVVARDAAGQSGASAPLEFDLPERAFEHPAAQAVIAVRKQLSRDPDERQGPRRALGAIADRPELFENSFAVLLNLRAAAALLVRGRGQAEVDDVQERLWQLALALEEGAAERTAKALEQARQAMRDAMDALKQSPEDAAKQAELDRRMQELREAIQKHMEALAEQARREGTEMPFDPKAPEMNARDLDRMAKELQDTAREGRMADADKQMSELEKLLEALQNARPETGQQREQRNAERRQQGKQQQDAVQDLVRREGGLLDKSRSRAEAEQRPQQGARPAPDQRPDRNAEQKPGQQSEAQRPEQRPEQRQEQRQEQRAQQAMRRALGELMQRFGDLTGQVPAPLSEADTAMREAGQAMAEGSDAAASAAQQRAIEALQKGGREMGQQLARQFGRGREPGEGEGDEGQDGMDGQDGRGTELGQNGQGEQPGRDGQAGNQRPNDQPGGNRRRTTRRDPLGRPLQEGTSGTEESGDVRVPDQMEMARTRAIQEELRRRGAERSRPQPELDYIDRLLSP